jgi:hypothetical protein
MIVIMMTLFEASHFSNNHTMRRSSISNNIRVAELEQQLQELRNSTAHALEQAWFEVETLTQENAHQEELLFQMQHQLGEKLTEERSDHVPRVRVSSFRRVGSGRRLLTRDDSTRSALSVRSEGAASSSESEPIWYSGGAGCVMGPMAGTVIMDGMSVVTSDSNESGNSRSGIGSLLPSGLANGLLLRNKEKKIAGKHTEIEKNLMRQLEFLQDDSNQTIQELELKLYQREAAIKTLERTVVIKDETILSLRNELDQLRAQTVQPPDKSNTRDLATSEAEAYRI